MLRYAELNLVRAHLVRRAERWTLLNARWRTETVGRPSFREAGPVACPKERLARLNEVLTMSELEALRRSVHRRTAYGSVIWGKTTAERLRPPATRSGRGRLRRNEGGAEERRNQCARPVYTF